VVIPVIRRRAQPTVATIVVIRRRAQPTVATIVRLTVTAIFAYLMGVLLTTTPRPVLAPLTALLVAQVSVYQTVRSAVTKVASVVAGVLLAVGLSAWVGFTWWSLGLTIAIALAIGYALRLHDNILEVPISAMLILSVGTRAAADGRIIETFVGAGAGLIAGLVLARPRVQSAEDAIVELCGKMAGLLEEMARGLSENRVGDAASWLRQARTLGGEIRRVDEAIRQAEESLRLNPRGLRLPDSTPSLREALETLEHEATTVRLLARSLADSSQLMEGEGPLTDPDTRENLAHLLAALAAAVRTYGQLVVQNSPAQRERLQEELEQHLTAARAAQDQLGGRLVASAAAGSAAWPLRGELVSLVDRFRKELGGGQPYRRRRRAPRFLRRPPPRMPLRRRARHRLVRPRL
jgi:uncharacterized membrane protein YgaE (UPF0421/DUF939 family)